MSTKKLFSKFSNFQMVLVQKYRCNFESSYVNSKYEGK